MPASTVRAACAGALGGVSLLLASSAPAASLELQGPENCSDREQLSFNVARLLGSSLAEVPRLGFRAQVTRSSSGYAALLQVEDSEQRGPPSERQLAESSCARLLDALAVVIVLAIQRTESAPEAASSADAPTSGSLPAVPPQLEARAPAPASKDAVAKPTEASGTSLQAGASGWLGVDFGSLPEPSAGVGLSFDLLLHRLRLSTSALLFPEQRVALQSELNPRPGADVGMGLGALSACYSPVADWAAELVLGACIRAEAGRLYGRGTNVRGARSEARWWIAPGVDLLAAWKPHPALRLQAQLGATAPLLRTEFDLGELGELYRPPAITVRTAVGLGVAFD